MVGIVAGGKVIGIIIIIIIIVVVIIIIINLSVACVACQNSETDI